MSKDRIYLLITKMHTRLNTLIENNNYDLLCDEVQKYSRKLDKLLTLYDKLAIANDGPSPNFTIAHDSFINSEDIK